MTTAIKLSPLLPRKTPPPDEVLRRGIVPVVLDLVVGLKTSPELKEEIRCLCVTLAVELVQTALVPPTLGPHGLPGIAVQERRSPGLMSWTPADIEARQRGDYRAPKIDYVIDLTFDGASEEVRRAWQAAFDGKR